MICTIRIPDVLQVRIDSAAGVDGRSKWILEACRMRLDGEGSSAVEQRSSSPRVGGSIPPPRSKPDMQTLRDICSPKTTVEAVRMAFPATAEIPICGKTWWEEGEQCEFLMDAGHKEQKHGMRGMVRRLDA